MWISNILVALLVTSVTEAKNGRPNVPPHYTNHEYIMELTPSTFDDFVFGSNYSTIVEFYAPWCGYCQQLAPEFSKAAKKSGNFAQFAAVNCDDEKNKQFCAAQNVKGFPTLITYRPPKTFRSHIDRKSQFVAQPYERQREAPAIIDTMKGTVKSYLKKLSPAKLEKFFSEKTDKPRALILTQKTQFPVLYKSLAVDFKDQIDFVYLDTKKNDVLDVIEKYISGVTSLDEEFLILVDPEQGIVLHEGKMNKSGMTKFLKEITLFTPTDGPFSERQNIIKAIKSGKAKNFAQYKKKQAGKVSKEAAEAELKKDEL